MERYYDFRNRYREVHRPDRVRPGFEVRCPGTVIVDGWSIVPGPGVLIRHAADDLSAYFAVSMRCSVPVKEQADTCRICLSVDETLAEQSFRIVVTEDSVTVTGHDERMTAQGVYVLEDEMNRVEGPVLGTQDITRRVRFSMRMAFHEEYPDEYLDILAHAGINTILVPTDSVLTDNAEAARVNDIIARALAHGLDTYTFSPFHWNKKHPEDEGAREYYRERFGHLFSLCPGLRGFVFVGEVCEFPSHDERTTMKSVYESHGEGKPSPGWFPCRDYPEFIALIASVIRENRPDADIVFWTYNWGHADEEARVSLIGHFPRDITLMTTFEVPERFDISPEITEYTTDYMLWKIGSSACFRSESEAAKRRGLRMYSMVNGAGDTWDIGCVPYIPAVDRWMERHRAILHAQDTMRLDGLHECHSYGLTPTVITELEKYAYYDPAPDMDALYHALLVRDFGEENADTAARAFSCFSEAMKFCVSTNNDQYGPARVGPSYPLFYRTVEPIPTAAGETKRNPNNTCSAAYYYSLDDLPKLLYEADSYETMEELFHEGNLLFGEVAGTLTGRKKEEAERLWGVSRYIEYTAAAICHVKRWHYLKGTLGVLYEPPCIFEGYDGCPGSRKTTKMPPPAENRRAVYAKLIRIAEAECKNAEKTIPLVENDSRLGYTPELGYCTSAEQLRWKIRVTRRAMREITEETKIGSVSNH